MIEVYEHPKTGRVIRALAPLPRKVGDYIYFLRLNPVPGSSLPVYHKIGTTDRPLDRLKEHLRNYKYQFDIDVLWFSPRYSKYTTLRIEDKQKQWWIENTEWEYVRNDRFIIPDYVKEVTVTVRKDYIIQI